MQLSFNGGIISQDMYGRIDQAKYQTGVADCNNFYPELFGGMTYRAGFRYVHKYPLTPTNKFRLIPFIFSEEQAVVLVFTANTVSFVANGGILLDSSGNPIVLSTPYLDDDLLAFRYAQSADVITITHPAYPPRKIIRKSATLWTIETIDIDYGINRPTNVSVVATILPKYQSGGSEHSAYAEKQYVYQVTAMKDISESMGSETVAVNNDLTLSGNYNTISWDVVAGATRYKIFKVRSGLASFIGEATTTSFKDDYIEANGSITPPLLRDPFGSVGAPTAVAYLGQRKVYGGGYASPQLIRMSRTATDDDFSYHIPPQDTDSIQIRFAARDGNGVKHLVPMGDLMILTSGALWKLASDGAVTATSVSVHPQSYVGANDVTPVQMGGAAIFASDQTGHVHEVSLAANSYGSNYQVIDLSVFCPNIFDGHKITDCALVRNPMNIIFFVRDDGVLLSLTYEAEQQVWAWAKHKTTGRFISVAAIPEDNQTVLYAAILRDNGVMIERMLMRQPEDAQDKCFVDSAIHYKGTPISSINGLDWLEGQQVAVFADGGVKPSVIVQDGSVQMDRKFSNIWIGLKYTGYVKSMPLVSESTSIVKPKVATKAYLRLLGSKAVFVGVGDHALTEYKPRSLEPYGAPPDIQSGIVEVPIAAPYATDIQLVIEHESPLPMRLLALEVEFK